MAKTFDEINEHIRDWVEHQSMFFVATAPLSGEGRDTSISRRRARSAR